MKIRAGHYMVDLNKMAEFVAGVLTVSAVVGAVIFFCWPRF